MLPWYILWTQPYVWGSVFLLKYYSTCTYAQRCSPYHIHCTLAGKTYTVTGNPTNPGLLPRLLDVLFNSIQDGKLLTDVKFKPKHFSEVTYPSEQELASERALKESLLSRVSVNCLVIGLIWLLLGCEEDVIIEQWIVTGNVQRQGRSCPLGSGYEYHY